MGPWRARGAVLAGQKAQAQAQLEAARPWTTQEPTPACHLVLFHLGSLYLEQGRRAEAQDAFASYLQVSARDRDAESQSRRQRAEEMLGALGGTGK